MKDPAELAAGTYTVQAPTPQDDLVFPRPVLSNTASDVIIRGVNLSGTTSIQFGGVQAASFTVVSNIQITAQVPASLAAGTHSVLLNGGSIPFTGQLAVADVTTNAATQLQYPDPQPLADEPSRARYDAEHRALYVVLRCQQKDQHRLVKYTDGSSGWSTPQVAMIPGLREVIVGPTGAYLLGAAEDSLQIDLDALTVSATYKMQNGDLSFPGIGRYAHNLALTNDGYVVVTFGCRCGSASAPIYFFSAKSHTFTQLRPQSSLDYWMLSVSGAHTEMANVSADGATVLLGRPYAYDPATGTPTAQYFTQKLRSNNVPPLVEMDVRARGWR